MADNSQQLTSSVHLSGAPRTALGLQPLKRIATGVDHVETMFVEMRDLEVAKDAEIARLRAELERARAELQQREEHEEFLIAAAEKLERKVQRRDHTVEALERHLKSARSEVTLLRERLGEVDRNFERSRMDHDLMAEERRRLAYDATEAMRDLENATDGLAAAEREAVLRRSDLLNADFEELVPLELQRRVMSAAVSQADLAFHRSLSAIAHAKRAVALHIAGMVERDISTEGRALLSLLRSTADDIAANGRATFFSMALAAPLADSLRRALRSSTCGGDCCVVAHRCMALCERAILDGDTAAGASFSPVREVSPGGRDVRH
jgi:predicted  nucleic acid-binding Zn-ribbon protein